MVTSRCLMRHTLRRLCKTQPCSSQSSKYKTERKMFSSAIRVTIQWWKGLDPSMKSKPASSPSGRQTVVAGPCQRPTLLKIFHPRSRISPLVTLSGGPSTALWKILIHRPQGLRLCPPAFEVQLGTNGLCHSPHCRGPQSHTCPHGFLDNTVSSRSLADS